jgi:hypothetical protein
MTGTVAAAISDEPILERNSLAEVTPNFVLVRDSEMHRWIILPIRRLAGLDIVETPYPGLLAVSVGLFVIAAGAYFSKQGDGAALPFALIGLFLLVAYFASRKGTVRFLFESGAPESATGSVKEATALLKLVQTTRRSIDGVDLLHPGLHRATRTGARLPWARAEAS